MNTTWRPSRMPSASFAYLRKSTTAICFVVALLAPSVFAADQEPLSFLFIGNSFTFRHDMRNVFATLAREGNPTQPLTTEMVVYGGRDLFRHYEIFRSQDLLCLESLTDAQLHQSMKEMQDMARPGPEPAFYTEYWKHIDASALVAAEQYEAKDNGVAPTGKTSKKHGKSRWDDDVTVIKSAIKRHQEWIDGRTNYPATWNYVVLQSWHDEDPNPETGYLKYASKFIDLAKKQNTQPILYVTSPNSQNDKPVTAPVDAENSLKEMRVIADFAKKTGALVVPVPLAVYRLQKSGVPITLRYENDMHPNQCCAYLTACLFYATVFNKSPEGLKLSEVVETKIVDSKKPDSDPDGHPLKRVFTDTERTLLQRTAWETIEAFRKGDF